ncbi:helix-turn-helix domain-containing protein [Lactococcus garvieae]|uniref:helix-turn-helix domain-containing protein n=1 Tax=Lactococcus garvieae TaxID=1363 RepID=UPI00288D9AE5|nr:helix-turn-helix transcriptional regulator [Lactococcus garvieae]MDT2742906.1 helix-turn-helix transcriptional regulator [Lactococcus garvieae]
MTKTKLQIMREEKGLSVEQLAFKVHYPIIGKFDYPLENDIEAIKRVERPHYGLRSSMDLIIIERFAQALGCSVDELVED